MRSGVASQTARTESPGAPGKGLLANEAPSRLRGGIRVPENRRKAEARARVIDQEIRDGAFDYLRWFPMGNLAARFLPERESAVGRIVTVRRFFQVWSAADGSRR